MREGIGGASRVLKRPERDTGRGTTHLHAAGGSHHWPWGVEAAFFIGAGVGARDIGREGGGSDKNRVSRPETSTGRFAVIR